MPATLESAAPRPASRAAAPLLEVRDLHVHYGRAHILQGVSLSLGAEPLALVGRNGMGKTTLCHAVMGLTPSGEGAIEVEGRSVKGLASNRVARAGVALVPQGRRCFPSLTVHEHLRLVERGRDAAWTIERVYATFPRLAERRNNGGTELSGGEQQMLAIGRGMMAEPKLLILDEPSLGLSPLLVEEMFSLIRRLHGEGLSIMLVEQTVAQSLDIADRAYVLENGSFAISGPAAEVREDPELKRAYLGL
jgi:branched-chain amino acid transport system ATP-binding protein